MNQYQIFSDSSCDIPLELLTANKITTIPFYVTFNQEDYYKEIVEISVEDFYKKLTSENIFPKTSLPSVQDYINAFKESIKNGLDVLCICITEKFSGSYQSAVNAKNILEDEYPNSKIIIVDSIQATAGQGLVILQAAYMQQAGFSIEDNVSMINYLKETARIMFTANTLEYFQKGGRIGKVASLAGAMLNLKPLIQLKESELIPYANVRGRKKSLEKCIEMTAEYFNETGEKFSDYDFCILNAICKEDALQMKERTEALIGKKIEYPLFPVGVTIGTYTGPYAIGVSFIKKFNA